MGKKHVEHKLARGAKNRVSSRPSFFDLSKEKDIRGLEALFRDQSIQHVIDDYREQALELFQVENPSRVYTPDFQKAFEDHWQSLKKQMPFWQHGRWIYYPWLSTVVHTLTDVSFQKVRTARNKNLINAAEQKNFYEATIGIAGLSVGNSVATTIVLMGGGRRIRIADFDNLGLSNTNRVRAGIQNLGISKAHVTARQIYEINPYAKVDIFDEGLTPKNIKKFFDGPAKLDIVVDEIDSLAMKYLIREYAKKRRMPVVMAADNGDNAVVDVERYDLNPKLPFFHGKMGKVSYDMLTKLNKFETGRLITKWVGAETVTQRMQESLLQMGKTIVSWPQLGNAALLNGAAVAYCVRKILNGQPVERERALLSMDEKLTPGYDSPREKKRRAEGARKFKKIFGL